MDSLDVLINEEVGVIQSLTAAAKLGETIKIIYHGGSQPGTTRDIIPRRVTSLELSAIDVASGRVKTFIISKIRLANTESLENLYVESQRLVPILSLPQAFEGKEGEIQALGWYFEVSQDSATVHHYFKNGQPRKSAVAGIFKNEISGYSFASSKDEIAYFSDPTSSEAIKVLQSAKPILSTRPWYVFGPEMARARSFGHLEKAVELFWQQIYSFAPNKNGFKV